MGLGLGLGLGLGVGVGVGVATIGDGVGSRAQGVLRRECSCARRAHGVLRSAFPWARAMALHWGLEGGLLQLRTGEGGLQLGTGRCSSAIRQRGGNARGGSVHGGGVQAVVYRR